MAENYKNVEGSRKRIFINNLWGGVAWGIGASLGVGLIIALLGAIGHYINFVPIVGNFVSSVIEYILQSNPGLIK